MPRRPLAALVLAALLPVTACSSSDGRGLPAAAPRRTTTTPSAPVIQPADSGPAVSSAEFTLSSPAFVDGQVLPEALSCTGGTGASPALTWSGTPADTAELALVVRDRTASGYLHWVVGGIDALTTGFGPGGLPEGAVAAINDAGVAGWSPPCPPAGSAPHAYELTLHALPHALALAPGTPGKTAAELIEQASVARASLTVIYPAG